MYIKQYAYALAYKNVFLCALTYFSTKKDTFAFNTNWYEGLSSYPFLIEFCQLNFCRNIFEVKIDI